mgnify:CR=1 FL=1
MSKFRIDGRTVKIGPTQAALLRRLRAAVPQMVWAPTGKYRRACLAMEVRGLFKPAIGWPDCWELTEAGKAAEFRVVINR